MKFYTSILFDIKSSPNLGKFITEMLSYEHKALYIKDIHCSIVLVNIGNNLNIHQWENSSILGSDFKELASYPCTLLSIIQNILKNTHF